MLEKNTVPTGLTAKDIMTPNPKTIAADALAAEALEILRRNDISQLVVKTGDQYAGFIHLHDLIREGII
jgi:arabinose-5-phosphate isomerase